MIEFNRNNKASLENVRVSVVGGEIHLESEHLKSLMLAIDTALKSGYDYVQNVISGEVFIVELIKVGNHTVDKQALTKLLNGQGELSLVNIENQPVNATQEVVEGVTVEEEAQPVKRTRKKKVEVDSEINSEQN